MPTLPCRGKTPTQTSASERSGVAREEPTKFFRQLKDTSRSMADCGEQQTSITMRDTWASCAGEAMASGEGPAPSSREAAPLCAVQLAALEAGATGSLVYSVPPRTSRTTAAPAFLAASRSPAWAGGGIAQK